ncbi:MAG: fumarylacetoacetate hydrolase family protein [Alphaproteobacteria bacterium]|nr:fumarylacetoacetate hydrolase family protein [Alphaproteobacteria bacterium]
MDGNAGAALLPEDGTRGTLIGRAWDPGAANGPCVVALRGDQLVDITAMAPTVAALLERPDAVAVARKAEGRPLGLIADAARNSFPDERDATRPWLLAPVDLQAIKAAGVTFAASLLERVVEEQARGEPAKAAAVRAQLVGEIGVDLSKVEPGSAEARRLKEALQKRNLWSQYLEVGLGPDAEIFTKCQPMASVGYGADIGVLSTSSWNNPEPEVVIAANSRGQVVGATLGNDVNLRDYEGRSALLLSKAKDNNASSAVGPFIRLFDEHFGIDDVRRADLALTVEGLDQFVLRGSSSMRMISRDPLDLAGQALNANHQYPDGYVLFMGTMFAPTEQRGPKDAAGGGGFTHHVGDRVTIASPKLGALVNRVRHCHDIAPWTFGIGALIANLARRGLLKNA